MTETLITIMAPVLSALLIGLIGMLFGWLRKKQGFQDTQNIEQALKLAIPVAIQAAEERLGAGGGQQKKAHAAEEAVKIVAATAGKQVAKKVTRELAETLIDSAFGALKFPPPDPVKKN